MGLGLFYQLPVNGGQSITQRYDETMEQVVIAEQLGYTAAWFAEFHFKESFSTLPSPFLLIAALASRTHKIKLGTAALIPALHHPVRLIEEAGMLDHLTKGRLQIALGRGGISSHFYGYDVDIESRGEKLIELLKLMKQVWDTAHPIPVENAPNFTESITPRPFQHPSPPISIVANSLNTAAFAAQYEYNCMINSVVNPFGKGFENVVHKFHADRKKATLSAVVPVLVYECESEKQHIAKSFSKYIGGTPSFFEEYINGRGIAGSAMYCAEQIYKIKEKCGLEDVICWFNPGGLIPHQQVTKAMENFMTNINQPLIKVSI